MRRLATPSFVLWIAACSSSQATDAPGSSNEAPASSSGGSSGASGGSSGASGGSSGASGGSSGSSLVPGDRSISITAGGRTRTVQLHVPDTVRNGALPLVIALHGNGDSAQNFMATSGLGARTDVIVAAPQGQPRDIAIGNQTVPNVAWDAYNTGATNVDVALLDALQAELTRSGSVQPKRIVAFGYSQGGYLAYRYAMEASDRLACASVVAAANPGGSPRPFARKVAFSFQIGSADSAVGNARQSRDTLMRDGHPVQFNEIAGAGHSPFPGPKEAPLLSCLGHSLP